MRSRALAVYYRFPNLVMHLRGGARIEWPAHGYLHERGQAGAPRPGQRGDSQILVCVCV